MLHPGDSFFQLAMAAGLSPAGKHKKNKKISSDVRYLYLRYRNTDDTDLYRFKRISVIQRHEASHLVNIAGNVQVSDTTMLGKEMLLITKKD
jgi:hypothetical protein